MAASFVKCIKVRKSLILQCFKSIHITLSEIKSLKTEIRASLFPFYLSFYIISGTLSS